MKVLLIVAIIFAIQPAQAENAKGTSQSKTAQGAQQTDSSQHNSADSSTPSVSVTVNNAPATPNTQPKAEELDENMRVQRRLTRYTGLLVLVGFGTACIICWQSIETHRAATAAKRAAQATKDSIEHMEEANRISRENMQAGQRAYVSFPVLDIQSLAYEDAGSGQVVKWEFRNAIENSGNTPAWNITDHVNVRWEPGQAGLPDDFGFPDLGDNKGGTSILAGKTKFYSAKITIDNSIIQGTRNGNYRLFFYGWVEYSDVFKDTPVRRTEFCHEMRILEIAGKQIKLDISVHPTHNTQT